MSSEKKKNKKVSVGIAVCRRDPETKVPQVLLVKCRLTYSYNEFVFGKYKFWDNDKLIYLFNNMTVQEKLILQSCDFTKIWYHVWLRIPNADDNNNSFYQFYINCKSKFEKFIARDNAKRLKMFIAKATSIETGWEIPKGRIQGKELELDCAIREVKEETGVPGKDYKVYHNLPPIVSSFTTDHTVYVCKYYIAADIASKPIFSMANTGQVSEITDVKFVSLNDLKTLRAQNKTLRHCVTVALKIFKKRL